MRVVGYVLLLLVGLVVGGFVLTALLASSALQAWDLIAGYGWWGAAMFFAWPAFIGVVAFCNR